MGCIVIYELLFHTDYASSSAASDVEQTFAIQGRHNVPPGGSQYSVELCSVNDKP